MKTKQKAPTPTFRAGINFHDPTRSGFARVGILGQEDLFPNEGTDFPVDQPKQTKSYLVSYDSPFYGKVNLPLVPPDEEKKVIEKNLPTATRTELMCTRAAAKAIGAVGPGELRPLNSQIVTETINKDRQAQLQLRDEIRVARMKEEDHWQEVEHAEALATKNIEKSLFGSKRAQQEKLAASYREQFRLHDARIAAEKAEAAAEYEKIKELQALDNQKELERQKKLKLIAEERRKEFQAKNTELLQKRQKRIEEDLEQERIVAKQHAEQEALMEQRELAVRKRREQLNQVRDRIISQQTKRLVQIQEQERKVEKETQSEVSQREEARRKAEEQKKIEMARQRNAEYREYLRNKDEAKMNEVCDDNKYNINDNDDAQKVEDQMRKKRLKTQQAYLIAQIQARKEAEQKLREEELKTPSTSYFLKDDEEWD